MGQLHGVTHCERGFAFASSRALKHVSRRIMIADRTREQGRLACAAKRGMVSGGGAAVQKPAAIHKTVANEGAAGRAKAVTSPNSVMMGGSSPATYLAPDMSILAQVAESIEALLMKAKPRTQVALPSRLAL